MKVNVRGKGNNIKITDDIQKSVDKAAAKLEKHVTDNAELSVVVGVEGGRDTVEMTLTDKNLFSRVEEAGSEMITAIHDAGESLERKLRKYKQKVADRYEGRSTTRSVNVRLGEHIGKEYDDDAGEDDESEAKNEIVRVKRFDVKPMFPEDAALEMELLGHDFYVFQNAEEGCAVNVIYRRKKGGYGLISPTTE